MAKVNLGIIIDAVNKAAPVLRTLTGQLDSVKSKGEGVGGGMGGGLGAGLRMAATAGSKVLAVLAVVGQVLGTIGRVGVAAFRAVGQAIGGVINAARGVLSHLMNIAKWLAIIGAAAIAKLAGDSIKAAMDMEGYLAKLTTALKDVKKAQDMLDWAKAFAAKTPFEVSEVVDATTRLTMYGLNAQKWLPLVGDLAGAMGKSVTDAVEAVADAVSGGGMERLKEFAITSQRLKGAGWTGSYQDAEGIRTLKMALESLITRDYGGGMAKLAATGVGAFSNFKDAISQLKVEIGQALMPAFRRMLDYGMKVLDWFKQMQVGTRVGEWIGRLGDRVLAFVQNGLPMLVEWLGKAKGELAAWGQTISAVFATFAGMFGATFANAGAGILGFSESLRGFAQGLAQWIVTVVAFVQANMPLIGQWFTYVVDMGKYLVAWFQAHLPDILDVGVEVFGGLIRGLLGAGEIINVFYTIVRGVFDAVAVVLLKSASIIWGVCNGWVRAIHMMIAALNKIPGVNLDNAEATLKRMWEMGKELTESAKIATQDQATATAQHVREGIARGEKIDDAQAKWAGTEGRMRDYAGRVRANRPPVAQPVMPVAPTGKLTPFGQGAPQINFSPTVTVNVPPGTSGPVATDIARQTGAEVVRQLRRFGWKNGQQVPEPA